MELNKIYNMDCLQGMKILIEKNIVPDLIICDPPYEFQSSGKGIVGMRELYNKISKDNLDTFDFNKFIPKLLDLQKDKINAYFFCNKSLLPKYLNEAIKRNLNYDILTLNKKAPIPTKNSSYLPEFEYIVFLRSKGVFWNGKLNYKLYFKSYFCFTNGVSNIHPTQKPLSIIKKFIKLSSDKKHLIFDAFIGSGTTAVACKELDRNFIGFEINKNYCEVANKRLKETYKDGGLNNFV